VAAAVHAAAGGDGDGAVVDLKRCFKCGVEKPLCEFYRHKMMSDGHLGKCKDCTKADVRQYWRENADVLRQTDRVRRIVRHHANQQASNAIRDGRLVRDPKCYYCDYIGPNIQAHHWNYYRPLDVRWLCLRCHHIADMARRDAERYVALYREVG
jgi:hypothetical protein